MTRNPFDPDKLVADFRLYDRTVDVVSAYHWFFTETLEMPARVSHFERYPRVPHPDGKLATPDFTVLFNDGCGLVAEVANIAQHDNSVEKLCFQLLRYDGLKVLPGPSGALMAVKRLDVLYLAPMDDAEAAVERVYRQRLLEPDHQFKPSRRPVMIQFGLTSGKYVFQRWPDATVNGILHVSDRNPDYAKFKQSLNIRPSDFDGNKVQHAFVNDPVPALYMATRLWTSVFPSRFSTDDFTATTGKIANVLRDQYRHGTTADVKAAMQVLAAAGLATQNKDAWHVKRSRNLRASGQEVSAHMAKLIRAPERRLSAADRRRAALNPAQGNLFDLIDRPGTGRQHGREHT